MRSIFSHRSGVITILSGKLAPEPRPGQSPVALDRFGRDLERFGSFLHAQPAEVAHLDHPALPLVNPGQRLERVVERDQSRAARLCYIQSLTQRDVLRLAPALEVAA